MNFLRVFITLACVLAGAGIGITVQALRITGRPQEFHSRARIRVPTKHPVRDDRERADWNSTLIETLESPELKRRAWDRVKALHSGLPTGAVTVRALGTLENDRFDILVAGAEPKSTRLFLDALLDEFVIFRVNAASRSDPEPPAEYLQSLTVVEQRASPPLEHLEDWRGPVAWGAGGGGLLGAIFGWALSLIIVHAPRSPLVPAEI